MASDSELQREYKEAQRRTRMFNTAAVDEEDYMEELLGEIFGAIGENSWVQPPLRVDYGKNTYIGKNFFANYDCIILDTARVTIGDNVMFGPRVSLYAAGHPVCPEIRNTGLEYGREIRIGSNVWIGGSTVINPGVTIGDNVVIGSGSVVTKDIPSDSIAVGVPCRVIRPLSDDDRRYWKEQAERYYREK